MWRGAGNAGRFRCRDVAALLVAVALSASLLSGVGPQQAAALNTVPIVYVGRVGSVVSSSSGSSAKLIVGSAGVRAGDTVIVAVLLSGAKKSGKAVTVADTAGNAYAVDRTVTDGLRDRVAVLSAHGVKPLAQGSTITVGFAPSSQFQVSADEFQGIGGVDRSAGATGSGTAFGSTATATTTFSNELLFGVVGNQSGVSPGWSTGWSSLATLTVGANHLGAATQIVNATGSYSATGTTSGTWMATITTYGPAPEAAPHAALTVSPSSGRPPLAVTADASTSTDTDATPIASYRFDFGDGAVVGPQSNALATHTYTAAGSYTIKVTATDTVGNASSSASASVVVDALTAKLTTTPSSGTAPLAVTADASASSDTDATPIASYTFDFGDGTVVGPQSGATAKHTYPGAGSFSVTVTVVDSGAFSSSATSTVAVSGTTSSSAVVVYAGYYDTHHKYNLRPKPDPWQGSVGVVFVGQPDTNSGGWDTSAVRVDNTSASSLTVTVTVNIGSKQYALWGTNSIPAGGRLVLAQMGFETFDGSDTGSAGCYGCDPSLCTTAVSHTVPVIHVTIGAVTTNYNDTAQILNTQGADKAGCPYTGTRNDESEPWQQVPA
jgi:PKD repeat protein